MRRLRVHRARRAAKKAGRKFDESTRSGVRNQGRVVVRNAPKRL